MGEAESLNDLVRRVREGDGQAAQALIERYAPAIRRAARVHLVDERLRRVVDSLDICQSVFGGFFVGMAAGRYTIESPGELVALLAKMAHARVVDEARRQSAEKRDHRRLDPRPADEHLPSPGETPSWIVANQELQEEFRNRLTPEDRWLASQRAAGRTWDELADELGSTAEGLRKQLMRAVAEVAQQLDVEHLV